MSDKILTEAYKRLVALEDDAEYEVNVNEELSMNISSLNGAVQGLHELFSGELNERYNSDPKLQEAYKSLRNALDIFESLEDDLGNE